MVYLYESHLFSNDYTGKVLTITQPGCNLSTTLIAMTLTPDDQKEILEFMYKYNPKLYCEICNNGGNE